MSDITERLRAMAGETANDLQGPERDLLLNAANQIEGLRLALLKERQAWEAGAEINHTLRERIRVLEDD